MSLYIDRKFVSLVSTKLERFKQKSEYLWNCRCPVCNDSSKNKLKARGYFYRRKSDLFYTCHNCGTSMSMGNFLKTIDLSLYREYQMERFKNESSGNTKAPDFTLAKTKPVFKKRIDLPTIALLPSGHYAKEYLKSREIPLDRLNDIYYAANFKDFIKDLVPDCDKTLYDEPRIVIPLYDEEKNLLGVQGRAIGDSKIKYITIKTHEDNKKIFGLDRVDLSKRIYVVEGPLDSMFLQNSVAMMDADLLKVVTILGDKDYVFVYDNESRNSAITRQMEKTIRLKKNIFIWPLDIVSKDINDYILNDGTTAEIQSIIDNNTWFDLRAKLEFEQWKKI